MSDSTVLQAAAHLLNHLESNDELQVPYVMRCVRDLLVVKLSGGYVTTRALAEGCEEKAPSQPPYVINYSSHERRHEIGLTPSFHLCDRLLFGRVEGWDSASPTLHHREFESTSQEQFGATDDPAELLRCPYDPNHVVKRSLLPNHLVLRCRPPHGFVACHQDPMHMVALEDVASHKCDAVRRWKEALRKEFDREASSTGKPKLQLSIAISHHTKFLPAYDIANFNNYVDFISVICYDYHFSYESAVNHHSPLYSLEEDSDYNYDSKINTNHTMYYFLEFADPEKLVLGIPTFGRTYKLENPEETALGSYADGAGNKGPITGEKGFFAYFEICSYIKYQNWTVVQPKPGVVGPYAYKGDQWVGYDDIQMTKSKAAYANEMGLGGVMFWTMDYDDFLGTCHGTKFPIIKAARSEFFDVMVFPEDPPESSQPLTELTTRGPGKPAPARRQPSAYTDGRSMPVPCPGSPKKIPIQSQLHPKPQPPRPKTKYNQPSHPMWMDSRHAYDYDNYLDEESIAEDLIRLIERAGGINKLCNIFRRIKNSSAKFSQRRNFIKDGPLENSVVLESQNLPPIMILLNNSSVYINELNIYGKPEVMN